MRLFLLALMAGCARALPPDLPYRSAEDSTSSKVKPLRILERGSGVVHYDGAPSRISVDNPAVATVVRFKGQDSFHVFGETPGFTTLVATVDGVPNYLPLEVMASETVTPDVSLLVGEQAGFHAGGQVQRVFIGDPAVLEARAVICLLYTSDAADE